jgi:hypothetical protein
MIKKTKREFQKELFHLAKGLEVVQVTTYGGGISGYYVPYEAMQLGALEAMQLEYKKAMQSNVAQGVEEKSEAMPLGKKRHAFLGEDAMPFKVEEETGEILEEKEDVDYYEGMSQCDICKDWSVDCWDFGDGVSCDECIRKRYPSEKLYKIAIRGASKV